MVGTEGIEDIEGKKKVVEAAVDSQSREAERFQGVGVEIEAAVEGNEIVTSNHRSPEPVRPAGRHVPAPASPAAAPDVGDGLAAVAAGA